MSLPIKSLKNFLMLVFINSNFQIIHLSLPPFWVFYNKKCTSSILLYIDTRAFEYHLFKIVSFFQYMHFWQRSVGLDGSVWVLCCLISLCPLEFVQLNKIKKLIKVYSKDVMTVSISVSTFFGGYKYDIVF